MKIRNSYYDDNNNNNNNNNSVALVRERTIPTERPPLVGEVGGNFLRIQGVSRRQRGIIILIKNK
jgi:hypothetical protein